MFSGDVKNVGKVDLASEEQRPALWWERRGGDSYCLGAGTLSSKSLVSELLFQVDHRSSSKEGKKE